MIKTLGVMKNLPANINLNDLFVKSTEKAISYRCLYPKLSNNYPVLEKGYLVLYRQNHVGEMLYITKKRIYKRFFYVENRLLDGGKTEIADVITDWTKISFGNNFREIKDLNDRGLFKIEELASLIKKYLIPYDDTSLRELVNTKFSRDLIHSYLHQDIDEDRIGETRFVSGIRIMSPHGHWLTFKRPAHLRYNYNNVVGSRRNPPTPFRHVPFYNNSDDASLWHNTWREEATHGSSYMTMNLMGYHGTDAHKGLHVGEQSPDANIQSIELHSREIPRIHGGGITGGQDNRLVSRTDYHWKVQYYADGNIQDITVVGGAREVIVECYARFTNGAVENLEPIYLIPGHFYALNYYHHTLLWNDISHGRFRVTFDAPISHKNSGSNNSGPGKEHDSDRTSTSYVRGTWARSRCPICNNGDRRDRLRTINEIHEYLFDRHCTVYVRGLWWR